MTEARRDELKRECGQLYRDIREMTASLPVTARLVDPDQPELALARARERRLVAELQTIQQTQPLLLENDRTVLFELLEEDLAESIKQLEICLTCVRSEERKLVQDIDRLHRDQGLHVDTHASLSHKLQVALGREEQSEDRLVSDLKKKTSKARAYHAKLLKDMAGFVSEHFPAPRQRNLSGPREAGEDEDQPHRYQPMLALVEELMNAAVDSPHEPYIQLEQTYWKPHVEQLLRNNVALRHPDDSNRIKLVPFHV